MRRLPVQQIGDLAGGVVEFILLVADVLDAGAGDAVDLAKVFIQLVLVRQANLAADDHAIGGSKGLRCDTRFGFFGQKGIKYGVGNPVADLIRVALGNGFRSERVVFAGHLVLQ